MPAEILMTSFRQVRDAKGSPEGRRILFVLALVAFAGCWPEKRNAMDFTALTYSVGDIPETTQILSINADGEARYVSHSNEEFPDLPQIGIYATVIDAKALRSLSSMLDQGPLEELPDHIGKMPKGITNKTIRLASRNGEIVKQVSPADPVDPRLQKIFDRLDTLVLEVMKHPRAVLQAEITSPTVTPPGNLIVELKLSNVGREEFWFRSAWEIVKSKDGWVRVEVWPAVPEPGSMWSEQKVLVQPTSIELVGAPEAASGAAVLSLRPKETKIFKISGFFYGKSGSKYVARVDYCNFKSKLEDKAPIVGEVLSKTTEFSFP
jgi:hypothetical protein